MEILEIEWMDGEPELGDVLCRGMVLIVGKCESTSGMFVVLDWVGGEEVVCSMCSAGSEWGLCRELKEVCVVTNNIFVFGALSTHKDIGRSGRVVYVEKFLELKEKATT